jgi:HSP20 family molecular chaperone IbpA
MSQAGQGQEVPMSEISVNRVPEFADRTLPVFAEMERLFGEIGRRAAELCTARGGAEGHALDDWLQAEREFCWPAARLEEREKEFELTVALPGFDPAEVEVTVTPREIIVHACRRVERGEEGREKPGALHWSELRTGEAFRRIGLPVALDVPRVKAVLRQGLLRITAPKATPEAAKIPVAEAA